MKKYYRFFILAVLAAQTLAAAEKNIVNGGFEEGLKGWNYGQWKGLPVPGRVSIDKPFAGKKCFVLTEPGKMKPRIIRSAGIKIVHNRNYVLSFALSGRDILKDSITVRILQFGSKKKKKTPVLGWVAPGRPGVYNLTHGLHGSFDWKVFKIKLPGALFNPKTKTIAVYFQHQYPGLGELKIDALSCQPEK